MINTRRQLKINQNKIIRENKWINKLFNSDGCCLICGNTDFKLFDKHHIGGKKFSKFIITVCANCHKKLSWYQRSNKKYIDFYQKLIPNNEFIKQFAILLDLNHLFKVVYENIKGVDTIE